jgi:hypothetical protein
MGDRKFGRFGFRDGRVVRLPDESDVAPTDRGEPHLGSRLEARDSVYRPACAVPQGPTRLGEWLMVDVRVARAVPPGSRLWGVCAELGSRGACGVIESTLVVDVLEAAAGDRGLILDPSSWPVLA